MSRYKRRLFYYLEVPGKWWNYDLKEWVEKPLSNSSNVRTFYTMKKALKAMKKSPLGVELHKFIKKRTGWISETFTF